MPAFNAARFIRESIESVLALDTDDWELIVVDDGSHDETAATVESFKDPRIKLIRQANAGQSAAQNRGIHAAQAEFLGFLDADDRYHPSALSRLHTALATQPEAVLAYGSATYIDEWGRPLKPDGRSMFSTRPAGCALEGILARNFIVNGGAVLIRRSAALEAGCFNPAIVMAQDWELWCRLALQGDFVFAGEQPVLEYRLHSSSVARTLGSDWASHVAAIDAVFENADIRKVLPPRTLSRLRRRKEADTWLYIATESLRTYRWPEARDAALQSLLSDPIRARTWVTWLLAVTRFLPRLAKRRIGAMHDDP